VREALSTAEWLITEDGFDPERANVRETLCTVGNGYLGTRGTLEEGHTGELSGTYLAGVYDSHDSPVIDLVNAPDWLSFAVYVEGTRLDVGNATVLEKYALATTCLRIERPNFLAGFGVQCDHPVRRRCEIERAIHN